MTHCVNSKVPLSILKDTQFVRVNGIFVFYLSILFILLLKKLLLEDSILVQVIRSQTEQFPELVINLPIFQEIF